MEVQEAYSVTLNAQGKRILKSYMIYEGKEIEIKYLL